MARYGCAGITRKIDGTGAEEVESIFPELQFERPVVDFNEGVLFVTNYLVFGNRLLVVRLVNINLIIACLYRISSVGIVLVFVKAILVKAGIVVDEVAGSTVYIWPRIGLFAMITCLLTISCRSILDCQPNQFITTGTRRTPLNQLGRT